MQREAGFDAAWTAWYRSIHLFLFLIWGIRFRGSRKCEDRINLILNSFPSDKPYYISWFFFLSFLFIVSTWIAIIIIIPGHFQFDIASISSSFEVCRELPSSSISRFRLSTLFISRALEESDWSSWLWCVASHSNSCVNATLITHQIYHSRYIIIIHCAAFFLAALRTALRRHCGCFENVFFFLLFSHFMHYDMVLIYDWDLILVSPMPIAYAYAFGPKYFVVFMYFVDVLLLLLLLIAYASSVAVIAVAMQRINSEENWKQPKNPNGIISHSDYQRGNIQWRNRLENQIYIS